MTEQVAPEAPESAGQDEQSLPTLIPVPVFDTVPENPPRFYVHADALHARVGADDGGEQTVVIPMRVKTRIVEEIEDLPSALEQIVALVTIRGEEHLVEAFDEMDIIDAREVARKFFQAFGEKEQARLGESLSSADSSPSTAPQPA